jgi:hypothetical protein
VEPSGGEDAGVRRPERVEDVVRVALGVRFAAPERALPAAGDAVVVVAELVREDVQQLKGPRSLSSRTIARRPIATSSQSGSTSMNARSWAIVIRCRHP